MDDIDLAQHNDELYRQSALNKHFAGMPSLRGDMTQSCPPREAGICLDCGEEISPDRLEANPAAIRCIDCQRKKERE